MPWLHIDWHAVAVVGVAIIGTPVAVVMSVGGYRFADFVRAGLPLLFLMWLTLSWLLAESYDLF